jgi:hypothetical protein
MNKQEKLTACLQYHVGDIDWNRFAVPSGLIIELGVAGGGSFSRICEYFHERACYGFDSFHGLPETYKPGVEKGQFNMNGVPPETRPNGVLVPGYIEDTLDKFLKEKNRRIAFVNFDMDLYKPTYYALSVMDSYFKRGTVLRFDEITGDGEYSAAHEEKAFRQWLDDYGSWDFKCIGMQGGHSRVFKLV